MRLLYPLCLFLCLFAFGCGSEEENPFLGKTYQVSVVVNKSTVQGGILDGGTVRPLTAEEVDQYDGDFAYNDLNDANFIGSQIAFVSDDEVEYGKGQYATAFPYRVDDRTATVSFNAPLEDGFIRDRDDVLVLTGDGSIKNSAFHYRLITQDGGRRGSEGGQFEPSAIDDLADRLTSEGDVYTYQTMTFIYTEQ